MLDEDYLILSTIHSAKGQEWKSVFVLNVVMAACPQTSVPGRLRLMSTLKRTTDSSRTSLLSQVKLANSVRLREQPLVRRQAIGH